MKKKKMFIVILVFLIFFSGCRDKETKKLISDQTVDPPAPLFIAEGIRKLTIINEQTKVVQLSYEPLIEEQSFQYWKILIPYGRQAVVDTQAMLSLYHNLESLQFTPAALSPEIETGLTNASKSIHVEYAQANLAEREAAVSGEAYDGPKHPSHKERADNKFTLKIGAKDGNGNYYCVLAANPEQVYLLPQSAIDTFFAVNPFDLIIKISAAVDVSTVAAVEIKQASHRVQLTNQEGRYQIKGKEVTAAAYRALYAQLLGIMVVAERNASQELGDETLLEINFKRNKALLPEVTIIYHAFNDELASVSVNGIEQMFVRREDVIALGKKIDEF